MAVAKVGCKHTPISHYTIYKQQTKCIECYIRVYNLWQSRLEARCYVRGSHFNFIAFSGRPTFKIASLKVSEQYLPLWQRYNPKNSIVHRPPRPFLENLNINEVKMAATIFANFGKLGFSQ